MNSSKTSNGISGQKLSLFSCILMGIGAIIGAGVFSSTPIATKIVGGNGVVIGFIFASFFVFIKTLPEMVMISALPANGASYMHLTRLVHPLAGSVHAFNQLIIGVMRIASMALTFSTYSKILMPNVNSVLVAVTVVIVFTVISCYDMKFSTWVQNILVAILLVAMGVYVFGGFGSCKVPFGEVITSTFELGKMWAAMGIMHGSLIGANALMYAADEVDNPGRNIPLAFIVSTVFTAVLYAIIAFVTVSVQPNIYAIDSLTTVAQEFMGPAMLVFFITGGALLAAITSINACILVFSRLNLAAACDGLFPKAMMKINKNGVPAVSIWVNSVIAILAILAQLNLSDVINILSVAILLITPLVFVSIFIIPKRYPNAYKASWMKIPHWLNCVIVVVSTVLSFVMGKYLLKQMDRKNWLILISFYAISIIYIFLRNSYIKNKKGKSMFDTMRTPYEPWDVIEETSKQKLAEK